MTTTETIVEPLIQVGLRVPEAAAVLGIGRRSVWRLISTGELASVRLGGRSRRILRDDLDSYLASLRRTGGAR
jgi:excisionase family DNA binding protein